MKSRSTWHPLLSLRCLTLQKSLDIGETSDMFYALVEGPNAANLNLQKLIILRYTRYLEGDLI